jgi:predicted nuclease of predicted toxin-antitoxin system
MAPRLLFDENLAARLVELLQAEYPGSIHVRDAIGRAATDEQIWEYARTSALVIVSKDEDFQRFSVWRGFPPKVIWIQLGNCSTDDVARLLRDAQTLIADFVAHPDAAFLPLRARDA